MNVLSCHFTLLCFSWHWWIPALGDTARLSPYLGQVWLGNRTGASQTENEAELQFSQLASCEKESQRTEDSSCRAN